MTSASRSVSPAGRSIRGTRCPAASSTAVTASGSSRPARPPRPRASAACSGESAARCGLRLGHRVVGVGGGEQARRRRERRGGGSAVVARAVETLVVEAGDRRERGQERGAGEDALGVVGVQPDPLPVVRRERARLLPDADRDRHPPEIVHQRAAPDRRDGRRPRDGTARAAAVASSATPAEWPTRYGEARSAKSPIAAKGTVDRLALQGQPRARLAGERLLPGRTHRRRGAGAPRPRRRAGWPRPGRTRPRPPAGRPGRRTPRRRACAGTRRRGPPRRSAPAAGSPRAWPDRAGPCRPSARPGTRTGPAWTRAGRAGRSASGPPRRTR